MATTILHNIFFSVSPYSPKCSTKQTLALNPSSQFLSSKSLSKLKKQSLISTIQIKQLRSRKSHSLPVVFAAQSNFLRVLQTAWKVGKDGIETGTNLVPDSVPRPVARISVTIVAVTLALFVFKSFLSTVFFVLAMMGVIYFTFIALNKDEGPRGGGPGGGTTSTEDSLEEARRIMEKYK
uniref:Transmembrane protein n=1 Tax=Davidia involucrata TaxID=16924 RepID=A0A5B7C3I6_DAVIN